MPLRILIVDDEPLSRDRLRRFLEDEPDTDVIAECLNGVEAVHAIRREAPDVVFLDVKMPELDGFGVLQACDGARRPAVIFVTAHDHFAVRAFEAQAVDYLLKPFDRDRLRTALQRARDGLPRQPGAVRQLLAQPPPTLPRRVPFLERVTVKSRGRIAIVRIAEVDWVGAADNYVELHVGDTVHLLRMTMSGLAGQLPPQFARINRSTLVNLTRVKELRPKSHGDWVLFLQNGTSLSVSRNHRRDLVALLTRFQ